MAKYSQTTRNSDGNYETREHTDYLQTGVDKGAEVAGAGIGMLLDVIFSSKIAFGIVLVVISFFVMAASVGWGILLFLVGAGFIGWWFRNRAAEESEVTSHEAAMRNREWEAGIQGINQQRIATQNAQRLAVEHRTPPTEPVIAMTGGETEFAARFWTK